MDADISPSTAPSVEEVSQFLGVTKKEVMQRAIRFYLESMKDYVALKKEFDSWDKLSDEALLNFEKAL